MEQTKKLTTSEQREVENNAGLAIYAINQLGLSDNDVNDWYGVAMIALCKAAQKYDSNKGVKFSTYAMTVIMNALKTEMRKQKRQPLTVNYEEALGNMEDTNISVESEIEVHDMLKHATEGMSDQTKQILLLHLKGYDTDYITNKLGVSKSSVHNAKLRLKRKMRRYSKETR